MLREDIKKATVEAMKAGDKPRTVALRQISAKIKDRDIEQRTAKATVEDDDLVTEVLLKMAKQRRESIALYEEGGRDDLAAQEQAELAVISEFLPQMLDEDATRAAIEQARADVGATGIKDMGRVMAELKTRHGASLDMSLASRLAKEMLG